MDRMTKGMSDYYVWYNTVYKTYLHISGKARQYESLNPDKTFKEMDEDVISVSSQYVGTIREDWLSVLNKKISEGENKLL